MAAKKSNNKQLSVPKFTEEQAESIKQGLLSAIDEVRADTIVTVFGRVLPVVPRTLKANISDATKFKQEFAVAFEAVGGTDRLAMYAHENYDGFINQMRQLLSATAHIAVQANGPIIFQHNMPEVESAAVEHIAVDPYDGEDDE
jgi:hypothetical protein